MVAASAVLFAKECVETVPQEEGKNGSDFSGGSFTHCWSLAQHQVSKISFPSLQVVKKDK